jgi:hypothetical protein
MNKIEFTISLAADNKDHLLLTAEYLKNLAGQQTAPKVQKEQPVETKKEQPVEAKKEEPAETKKEEPTEQGITMEELRKKGKDLAVKSPEVKEKIKNWLIDNGFKSVPLIPKESYEAYNQFLDSL